MEIWKPIAEAPGYEISSLGNVRSIEPPCSTQNVNTPDCQPLALNAL
jgi:hypothetical protein